MRATAVLLALIGNLAMGAQIPVDQFTPGRFVAATGLALPYRLLTPAALQPGRTYPLVVQVHGSGAIGADNEAQIGALSNGWLIPAVRQQYAAFVLVPQFPSRTVEYAAVKDPSQLRSTPTPTLAPLYDLVEHIATTFPVDRSRIYIVGFSMGASSALQAVSTHPSLFAAAMAIAAVPPDTASVPSTPILMLHGDRDTENPFTAAREWSQQMKARGARDLEFRPYPGLQHEVPPDVPSGTWWRDWLMSKRRHAPK